VHHSKFGNRWPRWVLHAASAGRDPGGMSAVALKAAVERQPRLTPRCLRLRKGMEDCTSRRRTQAGRSGRSNAPAQPSTLHLRPPSLSSQLRARLGPLVAAFVTFASATSDHVVEVIGAVVVGDLVARLDVLDRTQEHAVADLVGFDVRPAGVVGVAAEIAASRTIDGPAAIDLIEIAVATRLKLLCLVIRQFAALVLDDTGAFADRLGGKQSQPRPGAADTEWSLAGHGQLLRANSLQN
jgi:hypothetical protein